MANYADKRSRYAGAVPWDFAPGTPNADNIVKPSAHTELAQRTQDSYEQDAKGNWILKPGSHQPRRDFRKTTAPQKPESELPKRVNPAIVKEANVGNSQQFKTAMISTEHSVGTGNTVNPILQPPTVL